MSTNDTDDNQSDAPAYKDPETLRRLYWDEGLSSEEMAERLDCGSSTVLFWMRRHGIERKDRLKAAWEKRRVPYAPYKLSNNGYNVWRMRHNYSNVEVLASRLLAVAEYGFDAVRGKHVHHKNKIQWDDRPDNIELLSPSEHSTMHNRGENNHSAKLTEEEVAEIKDLLNNSNHPQHEIADRYDITQSLVSYINTGKKWSHVEPNPDG